MALGLAVGGELDLFERVLVGGVGDRDKEAVATLEHRQRVVVPNHLFLDQLDHVGVNLDTVDVEHRHSELFRRQLGHHRRVDEVFRNRVPDEGNLLAQRLLPGLGGNVLLHEAIHDQLSSETG